MLSPPGMAHTAIATTSCVALNCVGTDHAIFAAELAGKDETNGLRPPPPPAPCVVDARTSPEQLPTNLPIPVQH
jgi:hypothetical protein